MDPHAASALVLAVVIVVSFIAGVVVTASAWWLLRARLRRRGEYTEITARRRTDREDLPAGDTPVASPLRDAPVTGRLRLGGPRPRRNGRAGGLLPRLRT